MNIILNGKNYSLEENFTVQKLLKKLEEDWSLDLSGAVVLVNDEIVKSKDGEEIVLSGFEIKNIGELVRAIGKKLPLSKIEKAERDTN